MKRKKIEKILKNNYHLALEVLRDDPSQAEYYKGARDALFSVMEDLGISCKNSPYRQGKKIRKEEAWRQVRN